MKVALLPTANAKESKIRTVAQLDVKVSDNFFASFDDDNFV